MWLQLHWLVEVYNHYDVILDVSDIVSFIAVLYLDSPDA